MIFGLLNLLVIAGVGWAVVRLFGRMTGSQSGRELPGDHKQSLPRDASNWPHPPQRSETIDVRTRTGDERTESPQPAPGPPVPLRVSREERINELRRQYVADEITVEQYEAELDKLMRE